MSSEIPPRTGCERHKGDPHNLCEACWALEPPRKATTAMTIPGPRTTRAGGLS